MIIKNLTRKSGAQQLLKYVLRYILNEKKQVSVDDTKKPFVMRHNIKSRSLVGYIKEFKESTLRRKFTRKDQVAVHHTIISWNALDAKNITHSMLRAVASEYIKQRGINSQYIIAAHFNTKSIHLHCCLASARLDGRSSSITKAQFAALKINMAEFQRTNFPEIVHSLPDHGRSKRQQVLLKALPDPRSGVRPLQKDLLICALEQAYSKSHSLQQFVETLRAQGHEPYYRGEKKALTGITSGTRKFRLRTLGYDQQRLAVLDDRQLLQHDLADLESIRARTNENELIGEAEDNHIRELEMDVERKEDEATPVPSLPDSFEGFGAFPRRDVLQGA